MRWVRDYTPQPVENNLYRSALLVTISGNVLLAAVKSLAAYFSGSVASSLGCRQFYLGCVVFHHDGAGAVSGSASAGSFPPAGAQSL